MQALGDDGAVAAAGGGGQSSEVRLFVGGLGPAVINSDLFQTFSSLVPVSSVEVVRTKGRIFAYVTIRAAPHDIKRLFSVYNGCMWKGGRLKLEKAREYYMDKLRREWAERDLLEDLNLPKSNPVDPPKIASNVKESGGLKLYFPKLRKIKTIPEKGLGRHKRSFERVEPLPHGLLRVCNCDQGCSVTCSDLRSTEAKRLEMASEETRHVNATIGKLNGKAMPKEVTSFKKSATKGEEVGSGKFRDGYKRCGERGADSNLKVGATLNGESDDAEDKIDLDEPILNITGSSQEEGKNLEDQKVHIAEAEVQLHKGKVNGGAYKQKKRERADPYIWPRKEEAHHHIDIEEVTTQSLPESGIVGNKHLRTSAGRSWVQKASWKSLVGSTAHVSFNLGQFLDQNRHVSGQEN